MSSAPLPSGATVVLTWELGGGMGHVARLLPIARGLARRGHRPVLVLRELVETEALLRSEPFPLFQAPRFPKMVLSGPFQARSYADVLAFHGYLEARLLRPMVRSWESLLELIGPDLVIAESAPTACLAARGRWPTLVLGNGFCLPPIKPDEFPPLQPDRTPVAPTEQILAAVRQVQHDRRAPAPETLPEILAGSARFVLTLPQLDPYQTWRSEPVVGDLQPLPPPLPPAEPSFFVYLSTEAANLNLILDQLVATGVPGRGYVRGVGPRLSDRFGRSGLYLSPDPVSLTEELARAAVVVHHANQGIAQLALAAGRPQLVFPMHLEQLLSAQQLHRLGVAHYVAGQLPPPGLVGEGLRQLLNQPPFRDRAQAVAAEIHRTGPWDPLPAILERCESLRGQRE